MNRFKVKIKYVVCALFFNAILSSQNIYAQHFAHATGGGGFRAAPAPAYHAASAPVYHAAPAPAYHAAPAPVYHAAPAPAYHAAPANNYHPPTFNGGGAAMNRGGSNVGDGENHAGTINGGSQNIGNHIFRDKSRIQQPAFNVNNNENAFHNNDENNQYEHHPYHPYKWGQGWHPLGFFLNTLPDDASMIDVNGNPYFYDDGVFYDESLSGYTAVLPPIGAIVPSLPAGYETVPVGNDNYYYYGGVFYIDNYGSYQVVAAPIGAVVSEIPDGGTEQSLNGMDYVLYNNTYFEPISYNGGDAYEVVQPN